MKRKWFLPFLFYLLLPSAVLAQPPVVEPNQYEDREINLDTNYFHEDALTRQRSILPEELTDLSFDGTKTLNDEVVTKNLFSSTAQNTNTISSKVDQLGLFEQEMNAQPAAPEELEEASSVNWLIVILIGVVVAAIVAMLLLLMKYAESSPSVKN